MKSLSVIIINHNTKNLCEQTVQAVLPTADNISLEIIIVDNSTKKEEYYKSDNNNIIVLSGVKNKGFGNACNIGAGKASGAVLLFLNSDTVMEPGALESAYGYFINQQDIGALGIRTVLEDGSFDQNSKRGFPTPLNAMFYFMKLDKLFPSNRIIGGYHMTYLPENVTNDVDAVSGSFLMTSKYVFTELGGFDELFFMYGEDIDLCMRIKEKGLRVVYYAQASMLHLKGKSGLQARSPDVTRHFYNAMILFYNKHYQSKYPALVTGLVLLAIRLKMRLALRGSGSR